jgi:hypothetical protein
MVPSGPRVEALWLDEAYARAQAIEAPPVAAPGVRLVWSRGSKLGWRDLTATPGEFAVVGRHSQCDVVLPFDPAVALRHLLVRAVTLDDGTVATRLLDLKTGLGFYLDDDVERRALVASGPVALRVGRYALVALPSGVPLPEARPPAEVVDRGEAWARIDVSEEALNTGVYAAGERVRRARLPDRGATLRLAAKEPVILEWHPREPS